MKIGPYSVLLDAKLSKNNETTKRKQRKSLVRKIPDEASVSYLTEGMSPSEVVSLSLESRTCNINSSFTTPIVNSYSNKLDF